MTIYKFSNADSHYADTAAGAEALQTYAFIRDPANGVVCSDPIDAQIAAGNVLQRAGYNVNARGGVTIHEYDDAGNLIEEAE